MEQAIQHGADIIIRDWVRLRAGERILIVSSQKYAVEVAAMQQAAQAVGSVADVLMPVSYTHLTLPTSDLV